MIACHIKLNEIVQRNLETGGIDNPGSRPTHRGCTHRSTVFVRWRQCAWPDAHL